MSVRATGIMVNSITTDRAITDTIAITARVITDRTTITHTTTDHVTCVPDIMRRDTTRRAMPIDRVTMLEGIISSTITAV